MTKRLIHCTGFVPLVMLLAACEATPTEAAFAGVDAQVTSITRDSATYSVLVRVENSRTTSVWVSPCYTLQRSTGGVWRDLTSLSTGCPTVAWETVAAASTGQRELTLLVRVADSLVTTQDSLRAAFGVSTVGPWATDSRTVYSRSFTLEPDGG